MAACLASCSHGSRFAPDADVHAKEPNSGRTALHKAAFWGHHALVAMLLAELRLCPNARDASGDTPLHDAARFGHVKVSPFSLPFLFLFPHSRSDTRLWRRWWPRRILLRLRL